MIPKFWLAGIIAAIPISWIAVERPLDAIFFLAVVTVYTGALLRPLWLLHTVLLLPVLGEFGRIGVAGADGILPSDIALPIIFAGWLSNLLFLQKQTPRSSRFFPILPLQTALALFCVVGALSLLSALTFLEQSEVLTSSLYLIRYALYASIFLLTYHLAKANKRDQSEKIVKRLLSTMTISAMLIAIAGFIQLAIYPDLEPLEAQGWDPHQNRLVSTWLDPNFVGGLMAFISSILLGIALHAKKISHKTGLIIIIAILVTALFFTYSRSSWLAAFTGFFIISLFQSRKILIILLIVFTLAITASDRARERVTNMVSSAASILGISAENPDATARLRIQSWQQTFYLFTKHPILGNGYNTLRFVNHQEGFVSDTAVHSAGGSDSSLLTILATTGVLGILPFLFLHLFPLKKAWRLWRSSKSPPFSKGYALGFLGALPALLIHSIFLNSLLFAPILLFLWCTTGCILALGSAHSLSPLSPLPNSPASLPDSPAQGRATKHLHHLDA